MRAVKISRNILAIRVRNAKKITILDTKDGVKNRAKLIGTYSKIAVCALFIYASLLNFVIIFLSVALL